MILGRSNMDGHHHPTDENESGEIIEDLKKKSSTDTGKNLFTNNKKELHQRKPSELAWQPHSQRAESSQTGWPQHGLNVG